MGGYPGFTRIITKKLIDKHKDKLNTKKLIKSFNNKNNIKKKK
jgi:hypothetical protein